MSLRRIPWYKRKLETKRARIAALVMFPVVLLNFVAQASWTLVAVELVLLTIGCVIVIDAYRRAPSTSDS